MVTCIPYDVVCNSTNISLIKSFIIYINKSNNTEKLGKKWPSQLEKTLHIQ